MSRRLLSRRIRPAGCDWKLAGGCTIASGHDGLRDFG
jgi:hypothetical protein